MFDSRHLPFLSFLLARSTMVGENSSSFSLFSMHPRRSNLVLHLCTVLRCHPTHVVGRCQCEPCPGPHYACGVRHDPLLVSPIVCHRATRCCPAADNRRPVPPCCGRHWPVLPMWHGKAEWCELAWASVMASRARSLSLVTRREG